ncbi:hypothetical protein SAMN05421546_2036 [Solilutibacter tolerans]|uniref:Uncharacterized protein n=1 Tax=Solilutibacter tolerans TaxID=1604334 RepID=A0A1N6WEF9_9GAMM|nr:hypothetical protein SAMN05421546_2036 [Lysobacter tolerans]
MPSPTSLVVNGNFATGIGNANIIGHSGRNNTGAAYCYTTGFCSQTAGWADNTYPRQAPNDDRNIFSIQSGSKEGFPGAGVTLSFPGDPANNVPAANNWLYANGNTLYGNEYLQWEQVVNGLIPGRTYVFYGYVTNVLKRILAADDPRIRLKTGGTPNQEDGTVVYGPDDITETESAVTRPLSGWTRMAYSFTAASGQTSIRLKITDQSAGTDGDDFGLAQIGLSECITVVDLAISKTNTPALGVLDQSDDAVVSGMPTTYQIRVVNTGPNTAIGATITDTPNNTTLNCPSTAAVACTNSAVPTACPAAPITVANLQAGLTLGSLPPTSPDNALTLSFSCTVC